MPTVFTHPAVPLALKCVFPNLSWRLLAVAIICSLLPDADVISFKLGISYDSILGHRGLSHSFFTALAVALLLAACARWLRARAFVVFIVVFICMASHIILDAMTSGGLGPAMFWPVTDERYFLPWRPIRVSPIALSRFFSERGWQVIQSELLWVWLPLFATALMVRIVRRARQ